MSPLASSRAPSRAAATPPARATAATSASAASAAASPGAASPAAATPLPGTETPIIPVGPLLDDPRIDQQTLIELLQALNLETMDQQLLGEENALKLDKDRIRTKHEDMLRKIAEIKRKMHHKKKSHKIAKIFTWIGVAVAVLVAAIVAVVGVVTAQPEIVIAAVAAATLVITITVLNETGTMNKIVQGIASGIEKSLIADGMDPKKAKLAAQIMAQVTVAVIIIALQVACAVASGGADTEELVSTVARVSANIALKTAAFVQAGASIGQGAAGIAAGVYAYQATNTRADTEMNKAELAKLEAMLEDEQEVIREIIQSIEKGQDTMSSMSRAVSESKQRMIQLASAV